MSIERKRDMRISKLLMPAATLAGALALAGCGGGSDTPAAAAVDPDPEEQTCEERGLLEGPNGCETQAQRDARMREAGAAGARNEGLANALVTAIEERIEDGSFMFEEDEDVFKDLDDDDKNSAKLVAQGKPFNEEYDPGEYLGAGNVYTLSANGTGTADDETLTLDWNAGDLAKSDTFAQSNAAPKDHSDEPSFDGTYHGVDGTFRCINGACTSTRSSDGLVLVGTWTFTPEDPEARVTASDLAVYGWWVDRTGSSGLIHDVQLYRTLGTGVAPSTGLDARIGSAKFEGSALGKYAFKGSSSDHGHFTAKASLTADFGDDASDGTSLSGEITDFKVGDDEADRKWTVKLQKNASALDAAITTARGGGLGFSGETLWEIDGDEPLLNTTRGDWAADLYTNAADSNIETTAHPDVVVGGFDAAHDNALMIGSFGAEHKP